MTPSAISLAGLVKSQVVKGRRGADSGRIIHILQGNLVSRLGQGQLVAQIIGHGEDMVLFFLQYQLIGYGIVYGLAGNAQDSALLLGKGLACGDIHTGVSADLAEIAQSAFNGLSGSNIGIDGHGYKGVLLNQARVIL